MVSAPSQHRRHPRAGNCALEMDIGMVWSIPNCLEHSDERLHPSTDITFFCRQVSYEHGGPAGNLMTPCSPKDKAIQPYKSVWTFSTCVPPTKRGVMAACPQIPGCCDHRSQAGGFRQLTLLSVGWRSEGLCVQCSAGVRGPPVRESCSTFARYRRFSRICWASDILSATPPTETLSREGFGWKSNFHRRRQRAS